MCSPHGYGFGKDSPALLRFGLRLVRGTQKAVLAGTTTESVLARHREVRPVETARVSLPFPRLTLDRNAPYVFATVAVVAVVAAAEYAANGIDVAPASVVVAVVVAALFRPVAVVLVSAAAVSAVAPGRNEDLPLGQRDGRNDPSSLVLEDRLVDHLSAARLVGLLISACGL